MHPRLTTAAVLFALATLFGAACGGGGSTTVAARDDVARGNAAANPSTTLTTTTTAAAPDTTIASDTSADAPPTSASPSPAVVTKPAKPNASIEVDYQPADGAVASATVNGPNGTHSKSLESGAAIFGNLPAGTYTISITVDTPSGDPTVGDARQIINGGTLDLASGDHGVVTCDDAGCTGVLAG